MTLAQHSPHVGRSAECFAYFTLPLALCAGIIILLLGMRKLRQRVLRSKDRKGNAQN